MSSVEADEQGGYEKVRSSKFRFKSKRSKDDVEESSHRSSKHRRQRSLSPREHRKSRHDREHREHRRKKLKKSYHEPLNDDPSAYDDSFYADPRSANYIDPDTAFRESLF